MLPPTFKKRWHHKNVTDSKEEITLCLTQLWTLAWDSWIKFCTAAEAIDDIDQNHGHYNCSRGQSAGSLKTSSLRFVEISSYICMNCSSIFSPFGRTVSVCDIRAKRLINCMPASCWQIHWEFRGAQDSALVECCYLSSKGWQLVFTRALNIRPISRPETTEVKIWKDKGR